MSNLNTVRNYIVSATGNQNMPPPAPSNNCAYDDNDYQIAEFEDMNDNDIIYVRWSVPHQRAYMYSDLDRPTQWVHNNWTIRKTIEVGLGMGHRVEDYDFEIPTNFVTVHREMLDNQGDATITTLDPDNDVDWLNIERILDSEWNSYAANKIMFMSSVR